MMIGRIFALLCALTALAAARDKTPFPQPGSKKGLQVQMLDDALALGIKHATLNCSITQLIAPQPKPDAVRWQSAGREFTFDAAALADLDRRVKSLSDGGVVVYLILLAYVPDDAAKRAIIAHPSYDAAAPHKLSAFNVVTPEGTAWLRATIELLAARYSSGEHGRVWGWIVGNEVASHWDWNNMGRAPLERVADDYEKAVRLVHDAVRTASENARIYLSLDHHWQLLQKPAEPDKCASGHAFLDAFAQLARERGDFDWHVAFHPYPEDLGQPRFWQDRTATASFDTPRITLKNLELLPRYLARPELLWHGAPRRVILSEQGFHCREQESDGELVQAAAYCAAWWKVQHLDGMDAFILHRHVDHSKEGGLRLGLWKNQPGSIAAPERKRRIYEVFRVADTPQWEREFEFALPIVGIKSWDELLPR